MNESIPVLADPQFEALRVLRPFNDFATVYQGQDCRRPIMWTEQEQAIDDLAREGVTGYAPNLIKGTPVPLGSRVVLWIPSTVYMLLAAPLPYRWTFTWRMRNLHDYNLKRFPYHFPKQGTGTPDTTPVTGGPRVTIPAAVQTIVYTQTEPAAQLDKVWQNLHPEGYYGTNSTSNMEQLPLLPDGTEGYYSQGVTDPNVVVTPGDPVYSLHEMQAMGDELIIGMNRPNDASPNWDFTDPADVDGIFGSAWSTVDRDVGIFLMCGTAP